MPLLFEACILLFDLFEFALSFLVEFFSLFELVLLLQVAFNDLHIGALLVELFLQGDDVLLDLSGLLGQNFDLGLVVILLDAHILQVVSVIVLIILVVLLLLHVQLESLLCRALNLPIKNMIKIFQ